MKKLLLTLGLVCSFTLLTAQAPTNDECDDRITIAVETATTITVALLDLSLATDDDDALTKGCQTNANIEYLDVWYEFTMPVTGNIVITSAANTEYFRLYDSCGGGEISCDIDDSIHTGLTENTTYVLRYSERELFANLSDFSIQAFESEPNDDCSNAATLNLSTLNQINIITDLRGASNDSEISCENNANIYLGVW